MECTFTAATMAYDEAKHQRIRGHDASRSVIRLFCSDCFQLYTEIMDILRVKKAQMPPSSTSMRRRKVTSAANVDDHESVVDPELVAGPSS